MVDQLEARLGRDPVVAVTGATGQVGLALRSLAPDFRYFDRTHLDLEHSYRIREVLSNAGAIVHLGAMTDVDRCERVPAAAWRVNAMATEAIAETGARVVYVSTDYVFDGTKKAPYVEDDEPNPLGVYGRTKLYGERCVLRSGGGAVIRTSWVYGAGRNFISALLAAAPERDRLAAVHDQIGRPTSATEIAQAILGVLNEDVHGIIHLSGDGPPCSRAELAEFVLDCAGIATPVDAVTTARYEEIVGRPRAPRPAYSVLGLERARSLGWQLKDWAGSVKAYVTELLQK